MSNVFLTDVIDQPNTMRIAMNHYAAYEQQMAQIATIHPKQMLFTGMAALTTAARAP